jgi:uncharacterized protein (DUF1330 family)
VSGVLVIAALRFTDVARYRAYQAQFMTVFARFNGEVLAADEAPVQLEGETIDKLVVLRFPSRAEAEAFLACEDYQVISEDRHAGAQTSSWMVQAL